MFHSSEESVRPFFLLPLFSLHRCVDPRIDTREPLESHETRLASPRRNFCGDSAGVVGERVLLGAAGRGVLLKSTVDGAREALLWPSLTVTATSSPHPSLLVMHGFCCSVSIFGSFLAMLRNRRSSKNFRSERANGMYGRVALSYIAMQQRISVKALKLIASPDVDTTSRTAV